MIDIALLTEKRYLNSSSEDWYVKNILHEDQLIQSELERVGVSSKRVAWDDDFNPSLFRFSLFRTTWNYFEKLDQFYDFLNNCRGKTKFINPLDSIIWNLDKNYLTELEKAGINIVKTYITKKSSPLSLLSITQQHNWGDIVIKPRVSAAAWNTHFVKKNNLQKKESLFQELVQKYDMMVQPFQENIISFGELSLMMVNGVLTHAVLKRAKHGDFRVQDDFGGSVEPYVPTKDQIVFAENVLQKIPFNCLYARVDVVLDNNNQLALSELELIEPEMWFRYNREAAVKLAEGIRSYF